MRLSNAFMLSLLVVSVAACSGQSAQNDDDFTVFDPRDQAERERYGTITGNDEVSVFGSRSDDNQTGGGAGIGVNSFLWQASLETFDFIPIASADPFGGLIITDWYQSASVPDERTKLQIFIRDVRLRADGVKVSLFRQVRDGTGNWLDAEVDPGTVAELEDKVLTRARELRIERSEAGV